MPSVELKHLSADEIQTLMGDIAQKTQYDQEEEKLKQFSEAEKRKLLLKVAALKEKEAADNRKPFFVKFVNGFWSLVWEHLFFWAYLLMVFYACAPALDSQWMKFKVSQFYDHQAAYYQIKNRQTLYNLCLSQATAAMEAAKPGSYQAYLAETKRLDCSYITSDISGNLRQLDSYDTFYKLDAATLTNARLAGEAIFVDVGISPATNAKIGQVLYVLHQQLTEKARSLMNKGAN